jgi:hypothetical protein
MPFSRRLSIVAVVFALLASTARSDQPLSPLRLLPAETDLLIAVPGARRLAESVLRLEALRKLEQFSAFRETLDSTNYHQFQQFVAYYEKEMGAHWPQLLDEIAGGGIALGIKVGKNPAPTLLVVQGRDEKRVQLFARLAAKLIEQEQARQDDKAKVKKGNYQGIETVQFDEKLFAAVAGSAILISNEEKTLQAGLDLHVGKGGKSLATNASATEYLQLLPEDALATLWLNLEAVRQDPNTAAVLKKAPRDDPTQTVLFGGYLDIAGRSPYLAAGLAREGDDVLLTVRMPKGRNGMGPDALLHLPPAGASNSRPVLEPKGVLFSTSFFLDVGRIWNDRDKLFPEKVAKSIEQADKQTNPFLAGLRISKILPQIGGYHRVVVASPSTATYKTAEGIPIPAFAVVSELREPEKFGSAMEATLRAAALAAGFSFKLHLVEEKIGTVNLVGYRFAEEQPQATEANRKLLRYYSPCFARVGDQFLWCSTLELGRDLVNILQNEKKGGSTDAVSTRIFGAGAAEFFQTFEEQVVTQTVLDRAMPINEATAEVKSALEMLRSLGPLEVNVRYDTDRFRYDFRLKGLK